MSADRYRGLQLQIEGQAESIRELESDIAAKVEEIRAVTQLCERRSAELADSVQSHGETKALLSGVERDLEGTKTKLQVTRTELAEKKLVVDDFKNTAPLIEKQGESLLQISQQLASDVHGLHAKLERKDCLHASNEELVQDKLQEFNGQFKQLQQQLHAYRSAFTETSDALKAQLAAFVVAKNEDMISAEQVVADMNSCIASANSSVEKKMKSHVKAVDKTAAATNKVVTKQTECVVLAASEASASVAHAGESIHATLQTQQSAVADMNAAVSAHVEMFQNLAASFVEKQALVMAQLQDSVSKHMQTLQQQQLCQQKQIDDLKQQHHAATVSAKAAVIEALSLALDAGFARQTTVVGSIATAMHVSICSAAEASAAVGSSVSAAAAMSADAACAFVKACTPVAEGFASASGTLLDQSSKCAATITMHSNAATDSVAAAHKNIAAASSKLAESIASATTEASAVNLKLAEDVEGKLKVSLPLM